MATSDISRSELEHENLTTPIFENGRYKNPWPTWKHIPYIKIFNYYFDRDKSAIPSREQELNKTLPVLKPDFKEFEKSPKSGIRHMWIGHASSLVQFDGVTFLTDPVFSDRCAPTQWLGPKRFRPPPCNIADLPEVDCVVISHNHYDHLDYNSVKALNARFGAKLRWYVPMGLKSWMNNNDCTNVVELTWWQEHQHSEKSGVKFVCTPCQHSCSRTLLDTNKVLWSSWCVLGPKHKFHFSGDSGYCEGFKEIGAKYGPFTLSTIPIGAYCPRYKYFEQHLAPTFNRDMGFKSLMSPDHVDPDQAMDIHKDIKSQQSIGIHWGTFKLAHEYYLEPKQRIVALLEKQEMPPTSFVTVAPGDIQVFGGSVGNSEQ